MSGPDRPQPPVFVAEDQFDQLFGLATAAGTPGARLLLGELERATVVGRGDGEGAFARLGDAVVYRDLQSGRDRAAILSLPDEADPDHGRLSVLAPAGAALIGLKVGARFGWPDPNGRIRMIEMLEVEWR